MTESDVADSPQDAWPVALTIAGSDSSGGAGIQADLAAFAALGAFGTSAITALTAQNPGAVRAVQAVAPEFVAEQIRAVFADLPVAAAKTGMLGQAAVIEAVAAALAECAGEEFPLVVDSVMVAGSGAPLLDGDAVEVLARELLPRATLVTPNRPEAAALAGGAADAPARDLADAILATGCGAVLITDGHGEGPECIDLLVDGEGHAREFRSPRRPGVFHGTGCCLSAGITAGLARGLTLDAAVAGAHGLLAWLIARAHRPRSGANRVLPLERAGTWPGLDG